MIDEKHVDAILSREINIIDLLDNSAILIAVSNQEGMLVRLNKRWEQVTGRTVEELTSQPFINFLHPDDIEKSMKQYYEGELFDEKAPKFEGFENRYRCADGGYVKLEWHSTGKNVNGLNLAVAIPRGYE